jgi:glycosyltransferase involved in cell wall biosynthesis
MRYLIFIPRLCLGGAELQAIKLANCLTLDFGYSVTVLLIKDATPEARALLNPSIELVSIKKNKGYSSFFLALKNFISQVGSRTPKKIIVYLSLAELYYAAAYLLGLRIPAISMVRSQIVRPKSRLGRLKGKVYGSIFSQIFVNSLANFDHASQFYGRLPIYLPNFVENSSNKLSSPNPGVIIRLIYIARFIPEKNHRFLIDFIEEYASHKFELLLIGDDNKYFDEHLLNDIERLQPKIKYLKNISNVRQHISKADIFIFPSEYTEGSPNVILESMSEGVPVVVTSSQSHLNLPCIHYESGNLSALYKSLVKLLDDYQYWVDKGSDYLASLEEIRKFVIFEAFANDRE